MILNILISMAMCIQEGIVKTATSVFNDARQSNVFDQIVSS